MPRSTQDRSKAEMPLKAILIGWAAACLIRVICLTLRFELKDKANITETPPDHQMIWAFWHNRIFAMPLVYKKFLKSRKGAVLTSASRDGAVIAATVKRFGVDAVRGSTSRRGITALLGLVDWVKRGFDVAITPDGPRGPRYKLAPGMIKLAQTTGAAILPVCVDYSSAWTFRSWDRFRLPKPFSKVTVTFQPLENIDPTLQDEAFEEARARVEHALNPLGEKV